MPLPGCRWSLLLLPLILSLLPGSPLAAPSKEMPLTTTSPEARAAFEQGRDHFANAEVVLAAPLFDKAIAADEKFALAYAYRAIAGGPLEFRRQLADKAGAHAQEASPGEKALIQTLRAWVVDDLPTSLAGLEALLKLHPEDKWALMHMGTYHQVQGDWARAATFFEKAAAIDPAFAAPQNFIGYARMVSGDLPGAARALRRYVELRPRTPNAHDSLGELLLKMGRFDDSIASYRKALELDPTFTGSWEGIGNGQALRGRFAEAREAYARAGAAATDLFGRVRARYWRTVSYVHEGRTGEALASLEETRAFADQGGAPVLATWTHLQAAWILLEGGVAGQAAAELDAAAARAAAPGPPGSARAKPEVAIQRERVMALGAIHEFDAARALAQRNRAAAEAIKDGAALRWLAGVLAWTELQAGRPDAALEQAARAVRESPWTLYLEAVAREQKGDVAAARKAFAALARWNSNDLDYALVRAKVLARAGAP